MDLTDLILVIELDFLKPGAYRAFLFIIIDFTYAALPKLSFWLNLVCHSADVNSVLIP